MVKFEVYDETVTCIKRENLKMKEAENQLLIIEAIGVEEVIVFCPHTENDVKIRTSGNCNYNFKFTNNQMKKIHDLLVRMNGSVEPENKWY